MKKQKSYHDKPFLCSVIIITCIFSIFYAKYVYYSDTPLHTLVSQTILFQDVESDLAGLPTQAYAYPLFHLTQKLVHLLLQVDYFTAAAILLPATIVCSIYMYRKLILLMLENTDTNKYFADLLSLGAVFFNTARCWLNDWRYYSLQCGPNPFHNPTILFVRPFAIASLFYFIKWIKTYGQKKQYKNAALYGIFTLLSVAAKPSYAIVYLPAMGIYTLCHMLRNKDLKFGIIALTAVFPSLLLLVIQNIWVSTETNALNMSIEFGGFFHLEPWDVVFSSLVTFPVVIFLLHCHQPWKEPLYFVSTLALVIGWFQMYFLVSRDISWGYDLSVQFATVAALVGTRNSEGLKKWKKIRYMLAYIIFAYQVYVGIQYLHKIYTGIQFWI